MAGPGIGGLVQPQPNAVTQGLPPSTPEEHAALTDRWKAFFTNPAISAGLFQFGASLLSNIGTNAPLGRRVGLSLSDAGRAVGGAAKFQAEQQSEVARQQAEQERLAQGRTGLSQQAKQIEQSGAYQTGSLGLEQQRLTQTAEQAAADRELKLKELQSNDSYRKMSLALQKEQLQSTLLGMQTPRGRALLALQKNALDSMQLDPNFDVDKAISDGMSIIDKMFGPEGSSAAAAPSGAPAAGAAPGPAAGGGAGTPSAAPTPEAPLPGALPFDQAAKILKTNPSQENQRYFEEVYGKGSVQKALGLP